MKRLSPVEAQQRREKGLCYHRDERYTPGHKCKVLPQLFLLVEDDGELCSGSDSFAADEVLVDELQNLEVLQYLVISYHALAGGNTASTLRFTGHVHGPPVQVLFDGGSTNCFIQTRVAKNLHFVVKPVPFFLVVVGSG